MPLNPSPPRSEDVERLLSAHLDEHRTLPESARARDLGAELSLVREYSGRVVYELLQNALDRARGAIHVRWRPDEAVLEVTNDFAPVTAHDAPPRSDLHALLSLHSSTKEASESVGNKGVGFRSVFAAGREVEVWSRDDEEKWWGVRMVHPAEVNPGPGIDWAEPDVASFYAPQHLTEPPDDVPADCVTLVRLKQIRPDKVEGIVETIRHLQALPLRFLRERAPFPEALRVHLDAGDGPQVHDLADAFAVSEAREVAVSDAVRRNTGLKLATAQVRVMLHEGRSGLFWCYLPTEQGAGFGVDVQADFCLESSRKGLALRPVSGSELPSDPPGWNCFLVQNAADLIVDDLWTRDEVCHRADFWTYASPRRCPCDHLRRAVGSRLFQGERFRALVRRSFSGSDGGSVGRYREFFEAIEEWARLRWHLRGGNLYTNRRWLLEQVEASGASVLPIVEDTDDQCRVTLARPLVVGRVGRQRGDSDRIYLRKRGGETTGHLPRALIDQGVFITTFEPPRHDDLSWYGLLEFSRPQLLAGLVAASREDGHAPLLQAALALAAESTPGAGNESVLERAIQKPGGPWWGRRLEPGTVLERAANSLSRLGVPVSSGWDVARTCGRTPGGPWPALDEARLAALLPEGVTVDAACRLLGIGLFPLGDDGDVPGWPETPEPGLAQDLLRAWDRDLHPLVLAWSDCPALTRLRRSRWVHAALPAEILGGALLLGFEEAETRWAPDQLWRQRTAGGVRTDLLARIELHPNAPEPAWLTDLGIENPGRTRDRGRILLALQTLVERPGLLSRPRSLSDLYRRLVQGVLELDPLPESIPLLYSEIDDRGALVGLRWGTAADGIWHDGGDATHALGAFTDVRVLVARGLPQKAAGALGLRTFAPGAPQVETHGVGDPELARELRLQIWQALPDLLAAAAASRMDLAEDEVIRRQAQLDVVHHEDLWVIWTFDGRTGERGRGHGGDVVLLPRPDGGQLLAFDGERVPLVECAYALSELLCENRAFGAVFRDGLYAWSQAGGQAGSSVARFRRDHNLSDEEVGTWSDRLGAARLSPEERAEWVARISRVLCELGELVVSIEPGLVVRPDTLREPKDLPADAVARLLQAALAGQPRLLALAPTVQLLRPNQDRWSHFDPRPYVAVAAEATPVSQWTEKRLQELLQQAKHTSDELRVAMNCLGFAPWRWVCSNLGLAPDPEPRPGDAALAYAHGHIPLARLPDAEAVPIELKVFDPVSVSLGAREPLSDEAWVKQSRRNATGGRRAEDAVLRLAVEEAMAWRGADPEGFGNAVARVGRALDNHWSRRLANATDRGGMAALLHVAQYNGNAGFDLLVPEGRNRLLLVEVKRVASLDEPAPFFLSENERRRALDYRRPTGKDDLELPWRLWLVSSTGQVRDVTPVIDRFAERREELGALMAQGLRPAEWFFVLKP